MSRNSTWGCKVLRVLLLIAANLARAGGVFGLPTIADCTPYYCRLYNVLHESAWVA